MGRGSWVTAVATEGTVYLRPPRGQSACLICYAKRVPVKQWFRAETFRLKIEDSAICSTSSIQDVTNVYDVMFIWTE